jgi:hypothetical protein
MNKELQTGYETEIKNGTKNGYLKAKFFLSEEHMLQRPPEPETQGKTTAT